MAFVPKISRASTDSYPVAFDYAGWDILNTSNTLSSATVTGSPSGLTIGSPTVDATNKKVSANVSAGTSGVTYRLTCVATTSGGDTLTGYLDVVTQNGTTSGVVVYPSQLLPFVDGGRAMQLLYDDGDLDDDEDPAAATTIDGNVNAFNLCQAAWREVVQACARGKIYTITELTDYANDAVRGLDLIQLVADIFWCKLIRRRRYTPEDPQAQASECQEAQEKLQALRTGERIFDLTGVTASDGSTYGSEVAEAGAISVGRLGGQRCDNSADRFWACTGSRTHLTGRMPDTSTGDRPDCC